MRRRKNKKRAVKGEGRLTKKKIVKKRQRESKIDAKKQKKNRKEKVRQTRTKRRKNNKYNGLPHLYPHG
jgi:hypothetical protein